ncbi:DUF58 domain-containing protein [Bifidobacterium panos]|uniref:DUF58 domain-containing protein n=1 Tax=Bifidobacterium panos TaxID=2675321 RepID=A0ABX1SW99_9BIFI|nr:DUF58 domain-containing protein [Bifidobacterium sp. DSM 109963]NMN01630.1 DUF58 domain-containing protein [Bifidobacterium sp. DSM 109963]
MHERPQPALKRLWRKARRSITAYISPLGWAVAIASAICAAAFFALGWHELLAFGVTGATMMLAAVVLSLGNTSFGASISLSKPRVRVGDTALVSVTVCNPGNAPTASARADLPIEETRKRFSIPMLAPGQSKQIETRLHAVSRAVLPVGPLTIHKGDPFGLIRHEKKLTERLTLFIHPAIVPLGTLNAGQTRDLEGQPSGQIASDDLDFQHLREYEPGDDMRNVHWLSCAKTGELMIRQYEVTRRTDTSLTIAVNPEEYASAEEFELAVSVHASIGVRCLAQSRPLTTHAGRTHATAQSPMTFLDSCSAITPQRADNPNLMQGTLEHTPDASLYFLTVGSLRDVDGIKRMAMALPKSASCMVLQVAFGAPRAIRRFPAFALATVGDLNDLPLIMGVLA